MVSLHQKQAQPGSLCVGRTSASCDLKAGDCSCPALSPSSPIPAASRAPWCAFALDMWVGMSQSTGNIVMHAHHTMHPYLGKPAKIRENLPLLCIDSTLKKKTFYGINKNTDQFLRSEADKCQMCTTKGTLVLKTDQLQKMNWLCFSDPPTSPQNTWCGLQLCHPISEHVFLSFVLTKKVLFIKRNTSLRTLHVDKIKRQYRQV